MDRDIAQALVVDSLKEIAKEKRTKSLCMRLRPGPTDKSRTHFLISFNETVLKNEKKS